MIRTIFAGEIFLALIIFLCCSGCGEQNIGDLSEYLEWLNDPDHGLVQTISAEGVQITAKYLPPEYRAYLDRRSSDTLNRSAIDEYANSISFVVSFTSNGNAGNRGTSGLDELTGRQDLASYTETAVGNAGEYFALDVSGVVYKPVLSMLDHDYGMNPSRNIVLVFVDESGRKQFDAASYVELVVNAEALGISTNRFRFTHNAIADRKILDL